MRFINARELRLQPGRVWDQVRDDDLVITLNGKPVAMLTAVNEESLGREMEVRKRAKALLALDEIQRVAGERGLASLSDEAIEEEIGAVRRARRS